MKLYRVDTGNDFIEYEPQRFMDEHREETMEAWLDQNSKTIVNNGGLLIIGRQVTTNLNTSIDLLGLDREGNVAVVELKRDKTPRDVLAQALEYASFAETLTGEELEEIFRKYTEDDVASLVDGHHDFFSLGDEEAVSFNKNQRMVIVGTEISQPIRQSSLYLRQKGIPVTCLEFSYFQSGSGEKLLSMDIVIGQEALTMEKVSSGSLPKTNLSKFKEGCSEAGLAVFMPILDLAKKEKLPIHWGFRGFSLNCDIDGKDLAICSCYPLPQKPNQQVQSIAITFEYIIKKIKGSEDLVSKFQEIIFSTGLFQVGGKYNYKYFVNEKPDQNTVSKILELILELTREVKQLASSMHE